MVLRSVWLGGGTLRKTGTERPWGLSISGLSVPHRTVGRLRTGHRTYAVDRVESPAPVGRGVGPQGGGTAMFRLHRCPAIGPTCASLPCQPGFRGGQGWTKTCVPPDLTA